MKTAAEVMNREFFSVSPDDTIGAILHRMSEHGLGRVLVLDLHGRPRGVATRVEVERCKDTEALAEKLRSPAVCMDEHTPIDIAARTLALHPSCDLVLLDAKGTAVGALSPIDLLRAVLGIDHAPPRSAAHELDSGWNEAELLELGAAHRAPAAPGIILLSPGFDQSAKRVVWAEATENMRERLDQMLRNPQRDERLESILEVYPRTARFRCLTMFDAGQREQLARALCNVPACARCGSTYSAAPEAPAHASGTSPGGAPSPVLGS